MTPPSLRLYTAAFTTCDPDVGVPVRTSIGAPRWKLKYQCVEKVSALMPFGKVGNVELRKLGDRSMFQHHYRRRLDAMGFDPIRTELLEIAAKYPDHPAAVDGLAPLILLCFEKPAEIARGETYCHRHVFADWWFHQGGDPIEEVNWETYGWQGPSDPGTPPPPAAPEPVPQMDLGV